MRSPADRPWRTASASPRYRPRSRTRTRPRSLRSDDLSHSRSVGHHPRTRYGELSHHPGMTSLTSPPREPTSPRRAAVRRGDRVFRGLTLAAGVFTLIVLAAIAIFLIVKALPALRADTKGFLTTREWLPDASPSVFGIAALAFGTLLSSALALVIAVPIAIGVALYTTDYAPRRIATVLGYLTDMLAAVPSVIYGLWGLYFLARTFGWIPLFADPDNRTSVASRSIFAAAVVLAVMILPIISAISREVLAQVPTTSREAALALGATRWEMIRTAVLPPSRPGLISAVMLGLG